MNGYIYILFVFYFCYSVFQELVAFPCDIYYCRFLDWRKEILQGLMPVLLRHCLWQSFVCLYFIIKHAIFSLTFRWQTPYLQLEQWILKHYLLNVYILKSPKDIFKTRFDQVVFPQVIQDWLLTFLLKDKDPTLHVFSIEHI